MIHADLASSLNAIHKSTYQTLGQRLTVASLANSSTAAVFRSPPQTAHAATVQYVAQPRRGFLAVELGGLDQTVDLRTGSSVSAP